MAFFSTQAALTLLGAVPGLVSQTTTSPTLHRRTLLHLVVCRVADEAADCLSRVYDATVVRTQGDGVWDGDKLSFSVFFYFNFVPADPVPDNESVHRFVGVQDIAVSAQVQLNVMIWHPTGPEFND